jgi:tRNA threonylcarbamoyladenosine modification (KEOPS) complex Cgi121 subunit
MTYEELEQLSKAELIEMALHQQAQIEKLRTTLTRFKARLAESETRREHLADIVEAAKLREKEAQQPTEADVMEQQRKWEQATRDALRHLDDVAYLARSPLAELIARARGTRPDGRTMQQALYGTIKAMGPVEGQPFHLRQLLRYDVLRLTYLERKRAAEVAQALAISERQYYRELKAAIQMAAGYILSLRP